MIPKTATAYCSEDISLIENYEQAVNDHTQVWHCHHRKETDEWQRHISARNAEYSRGAVYQPFAKPRKTGEQTDSNEATIELLNSYK